MFKVYVNNKDNLQILQFYIEAYKRKNKMPSVKPGVGSVMLWVW